MEVYKQPMPLLRNSIIVSCEPDGTRCVDWDTSDSQTEVTIRVEADGVEIKYARYVIAGEKRVLIHHLFRDRRYQYILKDSVGNEYVQYERRLSLTGSPNFRDCGGYFSDDFGQVRWGYIYRSGQLSALDQGDVKVIESLDLDLIFDFRRQDEQNMEPSQLPKTRLPNLISLPINPGSSMAFYEQLDSLAEDGEHAVFEFMREINRDFVDSHSAAFGKMFEEILSVEDCRFLFHCSAGKDRTGFAAALILYSLGVPMDQIEHDYMLTNRYFLASQEVANLQKKYGIEHLPEKALFPMLDVKYEYIRSAFEHVIKEYSSMDNYLSKALGLTFIDRSELRRRYCVN